MLSDLPGSKLSIHEPMTTENRPQMLIALGAKQFNSWLQKTPISVELLLEGHPEVEQDLETVLALISNEVSFRAQCGEEPRLQEYVRRFPHLEHQLRPCFEQYLSERARDRDHGSSTKLEEAPSAILSDASAPVAMDDDEGTAADDSVESASSVKIPESQSFVLLDDPDHTDDDNEPEEEESPATSAPRGRHYSLSYIEVESLKLDSDSVSERLESSLATPGTRSTESGEGTSPLIELPADSAGDYDILKEIGKGGMGVVYVAEQKSLKRVVALKMLIGDGLKPHSVARFQAEAEVIARLRHPNIVQIFDIGKLNGRPFFSLEYVSGGSLHQKINRTPQPIAESVDMMITMAAAMDVAHQAGIIHRDLKPGNVLITENGTPKITDFGLAKQIDNKDMGSTKTGAIMGTPSYMAPEQALGKVREMGPAVDTYALGAIFYELLTGRPPFLGPTLMDTLELVRYEEPMPPRRLRPKTPRDLETICLKCLHKEPEKRYGSALELATDLQRYRDGEPIVARAVRPWERWIKWAKRKPTTAALYLLLIAVGVASVAGGAWYLEQRNQKQKELALQERRLTEQARVERDDAVAEAERQKDLAEAERQKGRIDRDLAASEALVDGNEWIAARTKLTDLLAQIDKQQGNEHEAQRRRADKLLERVRYALKIVSSVEAMQPIRSAALFNATLANGLDARDALDKTRDQVTKALGLLGVTEEVLNGSERFELSPYYADVADQTKLAESKIKEFVYELIILLADASAGLDSGGAAKDDAGLRRALELLERSVSMGFPKRHAYFLRKENYLNRLGMQQEARKVRDELVKLDVKPTSALDHYLAGDFAFKQERFEHAAMNFELAVRLDKEHFWARYFLSVCYLRLGRFEPARANLSVCISERADLFWLYVMRGYASAQIAEDLARLDDPGNARKNLTAAKENFERAGEDFSKASELAVTEREKFALLANRGLQRLQEGRALKNPPALTRAEADLLQAIRTSSDDADDLGPRVILAQLYLERMALDKAREQYEEAIKIRESPELYRMVASLYLVGEKQDTGLALEKLQKAIDLQEKRATASGKPSPKLPSAYALKARILLSDGVKLAKENRTKDAEKRYVQVNEACATAIRLGEEFTKREGYRVSYEEAYRWQAEAFLKRRQFTAAKQAFDNYLKENGKPIFEIYRGRGLANARLNDNAAAIEDYTNALTMLDRSRRAAVSPSTSASTEDRAFLLSQRGRAYLEEEALGLAEADFTKAIALLENAVADDKLKRRRRSIGELYNDRALARYRGKHFKPAVEDYGQVIGRKAALDAAVVLDAHRFRGWSLLQLYKHDEAERDFSVVIANVTARTIADEKAAVTKLADEVKKTNDAGKRAELEQKTKDLQRLVSLVSSAFTGRSFAHLQRSDARRAMQDALNATRFVATIDDLPRERYAGTYYDAARAYAQATQARAASDAERRRAVALLETAIRYVPPADRRKYFREKVAGEPMLESLRALPEYDRLKKDVYVTPSP